VTNIREFLSSLVVPVSEAGVKDMLQTLRSEIMADGEQTQEQSESLLVVQHFRPLVDSLEYELAQLYWQTVGVQAFSGNEVPFIVNNDGRLSEDAAEVFFANCMEASNLEGQIRVLELGAGTGLFALYFLDAFRDLCQRERRDYYDRLLYYASDNSRRTVEQWEEFGQFAEHSDHVRLGTCDAQCPTDFHDLSGSTTRRRGFRAVFANYVLDVLPAAVLRSREGQPEQLCVQTRLASEDELQMFHPDLSLERLRELAASDCRHERGELLPLLRLLEFRTEFVPLNGDGPVFANEAIEFAKDLPRVLHNFGALDCLDTCLNLIADDGFILINDYGPVDNAQVAEFGTATRFGSSIAMGLNFPLLEHHFVSRVNNVVKPEGDDDKAIHTRLLSRRALPESSRVLNQRFSGTAWELASKPAEEAREHLAGGRVASGWEAYEQALERNPKNWCVLGEVADFLIRNGKPHEGLVLARAAIDRNPWYSSWLWNILGDGLFAIEQFGDAQAAYDQARSVNPKDVETNFNLSFTYALSGAYREALDSLATALVNDFQGTYRERILHQQQRIMFELSTRWATEQMRMYQRASVFG
jgi:tetratricopeptide (TPR) repeat protein